MPMPFLMPWTLVRAFLARGRFARLVACVLVALAAVVWIAVASVVLRVASAAVLLLLVVWCGWLIKGVWASWHTDPSEDEAPTWRAVFPALRWRLPRAAPEHAVAPPAEPEDLQRRERELAEREAAFAAATSSLNAVTADLLRGQERLHAEVAQLQRELESQTQAMQDVVAKLAHASMARPTPRAPEPEPAAIFEDSPELELRTARLELEADLRLEKIEEQEEKLRAYEDQLQRREHQLANFVAQTQTALQ
jgi:hypothetical protein